MSTRAKVRRIERREERSYLVGVALCELRKHSE
jgi:hypothetical protein